MGVSRNLVYFFRGPQNLGVYMNMRGPPTEGNYHILCMSKCPISRLPRFHIEGYIEDHIREYSMGYQGGYWDPKP